MGSFYSKSYYLDNPTPLQGKSYDYVIVGGGTAGCILANRLSEDPNVSVLLIEAGSTQVHPLFSRIPLGFNKLFQTEYDWNLETSPQTHLNARKLYWPRGKMLGGSSSMNALMYHHCAPADFDGWAQHCSGDWSYDALQPYLFKSERFTPPSTSPGDKNHPGGNLKYRGTQGLWETRYGQILDICRDAVKSCIQVGIAPTTDFNTPAGTLGANVFPGFVDSVGQRSSTATAYLKPDVLARKNLTVVLGCIGTKLIFDQSSPKLKVIGVEIARTDSQGKEPPVLVHANKEVILCAGAIHTPQLLLLSGIGPRADLEKLGIPVIKADENVGANLSDHLMLPISLRAAPNTSLAYLDSPIWGIPPLLRWLTTGGGIFSAIAPQGAAFFRTDDPKLPLGSPLLKTSDETFRSDAPDGELICVPGPYIDHGRVAPPAGCEVFSMSTVGLKPQSIGTIKLRSTSAFDMPIIDPNYLSTESDVNVMIKGVRLILRIARTAPLSNHLRLKNVGADKSATHPVFWPGDADPDSVTDDDLREFVKASVETVYHPVGTARMGSDPAKSVVSPSLSVYGIPNLRIVDASIFPTQISGHPTAPIVAMTERAADVIKGKV